MQKKGKPFNPNCVTCGCKKTEENTWVNKKNGKFNSYCRSCDNRRVYRNKYYKPVKEKTKRSKGNHRWQHSNKKHYPDPEWVWSQLELGLNAEQYTNNLDKKYALKKHGNEGKANRWKNKNK